MKQEKSLSEKYVSNRLLWQGCIHGSYMKYDDVLEYGVLKFIEGIKFSYEYYCPDENSCAYDIPCTNNCDIIKSALEKYNESHDKNKS